MTQKLSRSLVVCALVLALTCSANAKSILLKHHFSAGQIDNYRMGMEMQLRLPGMPGAPAGPIGAKMTAMMRQKVLGILPDGSAKMLITCSSGKLTTSGIPNAPTETIPAQSMVVTLSPDGSVTPGSEAYGSSVPGQVDLTHITGLMGYYGIFPSVPVEPGQSWTLTVPLAFNSGTMQVDSVLLAAALPVGNNTAAKIKQTYSANLDIGTVLRAIAGSARVPFDVSSMNGGAQMSGWSVMYFSPSRGRLLRATGKLQAMLSMAMPASLVSQGAPSQVNVALHLSLDMARV